MERRTFLSLCTTTVAVGAGAHLGLTGLDSTGPFCHVAGEAVCPGAWLHVDIAANTPPGSRLQLVVQHGHRPHLGASVDARPGDSVRLETPYPHDDLIPGDYAVRLELLARGGRMLERREVGTYRVVPFRFSV